MNSSKLRNSIQSTEKMEELLKKQLIQSAENIKKKVKKMRENEDSLQRESKKMFKPITDPLQTLVSHSNISRIQKCENIDQNIDKNPFETLIVDNNKKNNNVRTPIPSDKNEHAIREKDLNIPFGVRSEDGKMLIGNTPISFRETDGTSNELYIITIGKNSYEMTPGLKQLLFQSRPKLDLITEKDKVVYKDILESTSSHRRGYNPSSQIQGNSGLKYCQIIKPLFFDSDLNTKQGGSLPFLKTYNNNTDFIYWDNPNELVERLKILIASKDAGNTNHDNEIISIIEELKEAGIIRE